jgi:thioredoxin reductase
MSPRYPTVAVIGSGPAGISALKALHDEKAFNKIRVFERRDGPGGTWNYDSVPQKFPGTYPSSTDAAVRPSTFPGTTSPSIPIDATTPTAMYSWLDTNVPAELMAFTHTPLPDANSPLSTERYGAGNATRPYHAVARYLLDLVEKYREYISFNTTVASVEKTDTGKWRLTLRRLEVNGQAPGDSWWQEEFDAVIVATGQYNVPYIPKIEGLDETVQTHSEALEHVNAFRSRDDYAGKKVVVIGGSFSAGDVVGDIYTLVQGPLYVSQSSHSPFINEIWHLPQVELKPPISRITGQGPSKVRVSFSDGSEIEDVDRVIFATGYRLSFPFFSPKPLLIADRLPGVYQHVFKIGDPSLAVIGLVRAPLLFRMMEYQSVAAARYYAGRGGELPSRTDQEDWEAEQVKAKGDVYTYHDVTKEMKEHMEFLRDLAGPPASGTDTYELPPIAEEWLEKCFSVFQLKDQYWGRVRRQEEDARLNRIS